jgi:polyhydroxybutyrate depolymerase
VSGVRRAAALAFSFTLACTSGAAHESATPGTQPPATTTTTTGHASGPSAGCSVRPAMPPGTSDQHLTSGGADRVYQLDVPPSYDGTRPFALVLGLHALTVPYSFVPSITGFADMAPRYDFIGVAPSGLLNGATPFWNAAPVDDNYDVTFIAALLDHLAATLCIDSGRVFSTGMSNGAQMSSLLACRLPDRITAIAPVAGVEFLPPCDGAPVPILAFHGSADPILPYSGGGLNATTIADTNYYKGNLPPGLPPPLGVDESMRRWAEHNQCESDFAETRAGPHVLHRVWHGCAAATELYVVEGGGHAWPGKPVPAFEATFGPGTTEIDATTLMFAFFLEGA